MDARAPAVVALVVARDPGPWFEETLAALRAQDYQELSVLVLADEAPDVVSQVGAVLPDAFVRRLAGTANTADTAGTASTATTSTTSFGAAVNEAMGLVEGAAFFLLCHDDVALDPDALHLMVEESFRSNAAVVTPKTARWDDASRLLHVGMGVDRTGAPVDRVQPDEVDHGQHDAVREVFFAPGGCTLVRADLLRELGGFDTGIPAMGEDLDLCWRAQLAGARVVVAPQARVRHLEALAAGLRPPPESREDPAPSLVALQRRHELRTVLKCSGRLTLLFLVPWLLALAAGELAVAVVSRDRQRSRAIVGAWTWNLRRWRELHRLRAEVRARRHVSDRVVRRSQLRGSARLATFVSRLTHQGFDVARGRHPEHRAGGPATSPPELTGTVGRAFSEDSDFDELDDLGNAGRRPRRRAAPLSTRRTRLVVWLCAAAILVIGSRQLLGGGLPLIGQFVPFPSWTGVWHHFVAGWQPAGVGTTAPATPAYAALGAIGTVLIGGMGLTQKLIVLACVPIGVWGLLRFLRPICSPRARLVAGISYLGLALPYDALAQARLDGLIAYAAVPWILWRLALATGVEPYELRAEPGAPAHGATRSRATVAETTPTPTNATLAASAPHGAPAHGAPPASAPAHGAPPAGAPAHGAPPASAPAGAPAHGAPPASAPASAPAHGAPPASAPAPAHDRATRARRWRHSLLGQIVILGVIDALVTSFVPAMAVVVLLCAVGLALGAVVMGSWRGSGRMLAVAGGATVAALVLCLPWVVGVLAAGRGSIGIFGATSGPWSAPAFGALVRFDLGPVGGSPLSWLLPVAALLPLLLARRARLAWAGRLWVVACLSWILAWVVGRGWTGSFSAPVVVLVAPAALAVAAAIGLGVAAFETDVSGFQFGWRQVLSALAVAVVVVGLLPVVVEAGDGRWDLPATGFAQSLSWMSGQASHGAFRVLWLGDPRVVPGGSWRARPGLAYATSEDGVPAGDDVWTPAGPGPTAQMATEVQLAMDGSTVHLGRLLAPAAVRYVVVVTNLAPAASASAPQSVSVPPPGQLLPALAAQDDLREVPGGTGYAVFQNTQALPERAERRGTVAAPTPLAGWSPVLPGPPGQASYSGRVGAGTVFSSSAPAGGWSLSVDGRTVARRSAFGWAARYRRTPTGEATLSFQGSPLVPVGVTLEILLWIVVAAVLTGLWWRRSPRRRLVTSTGGRPARTTRPRGAHASGAVAPPPPAPGTATAEGQAMGPPPKAGPAVPPEAGP